MTKRSMTNLVRLRRDSYQSIVEIADAHAVDMIDVAAAAVMEFAKLHAQDRNIVIASLPKVPKRKPGPKKH